MSTIKISDSEAVKVARGLKTQRAQPATKFVERTVLYPVSIEYKPGVNTVEIRTFVRAGEFCSPRQWDLAMSLEKEYPNLNKDYRDYLKAAKLPVNLKGSDNPLNASVIELG